MKKILLVTTLLILSLVVISGAFVILSEAHPFLPGDLLYDFQLLAESIRLELTFNPVRKAELALELAERRLDELMQSLEGDQWQLAASHLDSALDRAVALILSAPVEERTQLVAQLNLVLARAESELSLLADSIAGDPTMASLIEKVANLRAANSPGRMADIIDQGNSRAKSIDAQNVSFFDESFDHSFFPLSGGHDVPECVDCHLEGQYAGTPSQCITCHFPPQDHFSGECESCHVVQSWDLATFDHAGVRECLTCHLEDSPADHYEGQCSRCHVVDDWTSYSFDHAGYDDCQTCHILKAPERHYPGQCSQCHTTESWENASFNHNGAVNCVGCHNESAPAFHYQGQCSNCHTVDDWAAVSFNHSGFTDCASCHSRPSGHYPGQCSQCHSTNGWGGATFNHSGFTDCAGCHSRPSGHYQGQCSQCHSTGGWGGATFSHEGLTDCAGCHSRPSGHFQGQCSQCHSTGGWGGAKFTHEGQTDCKACHTPPKEDDGDHHTPPVGQCSQCHVTKSWDT